MFYFFVDQQQILCLHRLGRTLVQHCLLQLTEMSSDILDKQSLIGVKGKDWLLIYSTHPQ
jgi:hypothetical protein